MEKKTTKERILKATLELASEKGLGSISLSQIAKKVGIQKASLYNYFASKEELITDLYEYLRQKAKSKVSDGNIDYGEFVKGKKAEDILLLAVNSYLSLNQDKDMEQFYCFIMSQRSINKDAAIIMIKETEKMIIATKQLFYAMQAQNIMHFENIDMAAFSFAMAVHSIIDYHGDQLNAKCELTTEKLLKEYILDFCHIYEKNR